MKRNTGKVVVLGLAAMIFAAAAAGQASGPPVRHVRAAAVAGSFYPADPKELQAAVDNFLARAPGAPLAGAVALVAPHAGYVYSGPVAAYSYAAIKGRHVARVVVIAPSHFEAFSYVSIYDGDAYETPLGAVPVDKAFAARLAGMDAALKLSARGHTPQQQRREHAIEVQLPFLQRALGSFQVVPIIMGEQGYASSRALGIALAKLIQASPGGSRDTLIVASSDLSHYHDYAEAVRLDGNTLQAVQDWDYFSLSRNLTAGRWEACGGGPIVAAMIAAERLGASQALLLKYANSGDTGGERGRVVGYGAVALAQGPRAARPQAFSLDERQKQQLLELARKSVETAVRERKLYEPLAADYAAFARERGAFVTLKRHGELRGCIGYTDASRPLYLTVRDVAAFAALRDNRFPPVTSAEFGELEYEISVLSPLRRVRDPKEIEVGRHGLLMKQGGYEGLLLPQVPVEQRWDRNTFLEQTAMKAGLRPSAWRDEHTDIFRFEALVFGEGKPKQKLSVPASPAAPPTAGAPKGR